MTPLIILGQSSNHQLRDVVVDVAGLPLSAIFLDSVVVFFVIQCASPETWSFTGNQLQEKEIM